MRMSARVLVWTVLCLAPAWAPGRGWAAAEPKTAKVARDVLTLSGVQGGLVVHLGGGPDAAALTAALRADGRYVVQGLRTDPHRVTDDRARLHAKGVYGPVSVALQAGARLPYADDLVNLIVCEDAGKVPAKEMLRVLAPGGCLCVRKDGAWTRTVKPVPDELDEWSHFLHDASNNAVAADTRVGPPRGLRWQAGPRWTRSHEYTTSLVAMISAGGRLFYVFDEGLTGVTPTFLPERWTLIARDAYNGVLLWRRSLPKWRGTWKQRSLRGLPGWVPRRLVAAGDRLYVTLEGDKPVAVLDAATGKQLASFDDTTGCDELRLTDGVLLARIPRTGLRAIDVATGKALWTTKPAPQPGTLAAAGGRVVAQMGKATVCLGLRDGKEVWRAAGKDRLSLLVLHEGRVLLAGRKSVRALSLDDGKALWTGPGGIGRSEMFAAAGHLWHWQGETVVGRDLKTGKLTARPDTGDVFTPGHHLRCYQSKATTQYLITPFRGVEFVSLTGGPSAQADWTRGPCRYGIVPANGLLYVPPNPCFCYPGVKVPGFNAYTPADQTHNDPAPRLHKGPAHGKVEVPAAVTEAQADWPAYRHDGRRTGATATAVAAKVGRQWQVKLPAPLTPPVATAGRVYVAAKHEHTLYALRLADGKRAWHFTAGGPIDSPPTVFGPLVLLGGADGCVYCLRAEDGALVWQFRAAPSQRKIVCESRLESPWRVHGSVLVAPSGPGGKGRPLAYCSAGRNTYLDGGIRLFALDPATGEVVHKTTLSTWSRTRDDAVGKPFVPAYHMEGANSDVLVCQNGSIYFGQYRLAPDLTERPAPYIMATPGEKVTPLDLHGKPYTAGNVRASYEKHQRDWIERTQKGLIEQLTKKFGGWSLGDRAMGLHVMATGTFLDDSWFNRTYWMYAATWPGYYLAHRAPKTGQLLTVGPDRTYAVQTYTTRNLQSPLFTPGQKGYLLTADANDNEPVLSSQTRGTTKGWGFTRMADPAWFAWVPIRIRAMVLAGKHLFLAGPPDVVDPDDPMAAFEGRKGGVLRTCHAADGKTLAERNLSAPPIFDGLIAADGKLLMVTTTGEVLCLGQK